MNNLIRSLLAVLVVTGVACSTPGLPKEITEARIAVQDAKNANAEQLATRTYDTAVSHLNKAESDWNAKNDVATAGHWAKLAEAEARKAQSMAEIKTAEGNIPRETARRARGEVAIRDAEIAILQAKGQSEAKREVAQLKTELKETQRSAEEIQKIKEEELQRALSKLAAVREEARGLILTLPGSIYFDVNKAAVKPAMHARLTEIAQALVNIPEQKVLIEGHTDADGSDDYNLQLSRLRAEAVRSILVAGGISTDRIETQGYGETKPLATNATAAGKAQNRRVEIVLPGRAGTKG